MYSITVNGKKNIKTDIRLDQNKFDGTLGEAIVNGDYIKINDYQYHIILNDKSYNIDVLKLNEEEKTMVLKINNVRCALQLKDKYDELLHTLGLDKLASKKLGDIKAPMPGMVLNILVSEGDTVKKGDALLVLEAMKMENILKSPADGIIKKIAATKGTAVEKNQLLIQF